LVPATQEIPAATRQSFAMLLNTNDEISKWYRSF
jgi:hypothetical protein